jgi:hypothetical protein
MRKVFEQRIGQRSDATRVRTRGVALVLPRCPADPPEPRCAAKSLPGSAPWGSPARTADRDGPALHAYAGVAPVTQQSGRRLLVSMRHACNHRLRNALYYHAMGRGSLPADPIARRHYDRLRGEGHSHARALRGVADRWVAVLIARLQWGTPYAATRRKAWPTADAAPAAEATA